MSKEEVIKIAEVQGRLFGFMCANGGYMFSYVTQWMKSGLRRKLDELPEPTEDLYVWYTQEINSNDDFIVIRTRTEVGNDEVVKHEWIGGVYACIQIVTGIRSSSLLEFIPYRLLYNMWDKYKRYDIYESSLRICRENPVLRGYLAVG